LSDKNYSTATSADTEGSSSSSRKQIIKGLNEDLAREYKAIIQYVVFSSALKDAEYIDIAGPVEATRFSGTGSCAGSCETDRLSWRQSDGDTKAGRVLE
jgi:hypothetical protein